MSSVKRSRRFFSMPIVSVGEAQQIGYVKNLIVNSATLEVVALLVDPKGFFKEQKVIPYARVKSIGEDAIIIEKTTNAEKPANLPQIMQFIKEKIDLVGTKVIDETGQALGVVEEFMVEPASGKIVSLEIGGKFLSSLAKGKAYLPAAEIKTIGRDVIIANAAAAEKMARAEAGLPETLKNLKDSSSHLLEATWRKSKDLGQTIQKGLPKKSSKTAAEEEEAPPVAEAAPAPPVQEETPPPAEEYLQQQPQEVWPEDVQQPEAQIPPKTEEPPIK